MSSISTNFLLWIICVPFLEFCKWRVASWLHARNVSASERCFCNACTSVSCAMHKQPLRCRAKAIFCIQSNWKAYVLKRRALCDAAIAQELFEISGVNAKPQVFFIGDHELEPIGCSECEVWAVDWTRMDTLHSGSVSVGVQDCGAESLVGHTNKDGERQVQMSFKGSSRCDCKRGYRVRKRCSGKGLRQTCQCLRMFHEKGCGIVGDETSIQVLSATPELRLRNTGVG